jgi:hypothetical protein
VTAEVSELRELATQIENEGLTLPLDDLVQITIGPDGAKVVTRLSCSVCADRVVTDAMKLAAIAAGSFERVGHLITIGGAPPKIWTIDDAVAAALYAALKAAQ